VVGVRIIVTGSRTWQDRRTFGWALDVTLALAMGRGEGLIVVHGAAPDGADALAHVWALRRQAGGAPVEEQPCPAEWDLCTPDCRHREKRRKGKVYCPVAGFRRNQLMVDGGADYCLAFVERCPCPDTSRNGESGMHGTHGTVDCIDRAKAASITVKPFRPRETV
jgi:hypothetical protein